MTELDEILSDLEYFHKKVLQESRRRRKWIVGFGGWALIPVIGIFIGVIIGDISGALKVGVICWIVEVATFLMVASVFPLPNVKSYQDELIAARIRHLDLILGR